MAAKRFGRVHCYQPTPEVLISKNNQSRIFKSFSDATATADATVAHSDALDDSWTTSESLENHGQR